MSRRRKAEFPRTEIYRKLDIVVIGILWMADIFEPWIYGWLSFTFEILFGDNYGNQGTVHTYGFPVLLLKCAVSVVLSVTVDLKNRKAMVTFIGLCFASLTPVLAIITIITRSEVYALASLCVYSVFFVVTPLRYVLIFNQKLHPSSLQVRKIVASLEVMKSLSGFFFYLSKPDPKTFKIPALIVRWVILIPLLVFLVTLLDVVRRKTAIDDPKERTFKSAATGILRDIKKSLTDDPESKRKKAIAIYQFSLFIILLLPVVTVVIANLILVKIEAKLNAHVVPGPGVNSYNVIDYKFYAYIANIIAIPLIVVIINLFKNTIQTFADYLLLAFGHVFNSAVLLYLSIALMQKQFGDTNQFDPNENVSSIKNVTEIERPGVAVIYIIACARNATTDTVFIETPDSNYTLDRTTHYSLQMAVTLTVHEKLYSWRATTILNSSPWKTSSKITPNKRFFYLIVLRRGNIQQIVEYSGAETIHPQVNPVLLIANGMTRELENITYIPTFLLYPVANPSDESHLHLPPARTILRVPIPEVGKWAFSYNMTEEYKNKISKNSSTKPLKLFFDLEPYSEKLVNLGDYGGGIHKTDICIIAVTLTSFNLSELVIKVEAKEVFNPPVNALKGVAGAAISVGYLQFFWLESPLRFRTTMLSLVMIGETITAYVVNTVITDVTTTAVITLTSIVCFLGAIHVIVGRIYETRLRRELWYVTPAVRSV